MKKTYHILLAAFLMQACCSKEALLDISVQQFVFLDKTTHRNLFFDADAVYNKDSIFISYDKGITYEKEVIHDSLKPGGQFFLIEFHPYVWMSQVGPDLSIRYSYFNAGPITELGSGTYAEREAKITYREHGWNHPLSDLMSALISAGLRVDHFAEYDYTPFDIFPGLVARPGNPPGFWFAAHPGMIPLVFSLRVSRPA